MTYKAMYKCRLCGETFTDMITSNDDLVKEIIIKLCCNVKVNTIMAPDLLAPHVCSNKGYGIADFQGFDAEEE